MPVDRPQIRVKAMVIAPNDDLASHADSLNAPTAETTEGYHRLISGGVELGQTPHDAMVRSLDEELGATIAT